MLVNASVLMPAGYNTCANRRPPESPSCEAGTDLTMTLFSPEASVST